MDMPTIGRSDIPLRQTRAENFRKKTKATNSPNTSNEDKKPTYIKRTNTLHPNIPSWKRGFFTTIHFSLEPYDLENH